MNALAPFVGVGVYRISDAARLAEVPAPKARAWVLGYPRRNGSEAADIRTSPRLPSRLPRQDEEALVSFADLIEMRFVRHFRRAGVRWSYITKAMPLLREVFREAGHGNVTFETDGVKVFADALAESGDRHAVDLVDRNYVMAEVLRQSFREELKLDAAGVVLGWTPRREFPAVIIDPHRSFGQPIVHPGIPTSVLADDFRLRHGDAAKVAARYEISAEAVMDAVRFEQTLKAAA